MKLSQVKLIGAYYLSGQVAGGWVGGWMALEESNLRLTSAKVEVVVEAEIGKKVVNKDC